MTGKPTIEITDTDWQPCQDWEPHEVAPEYCANCGSVLLMHGDRLAHLFDVLAALP